MKALQKLAGQTAIYGLPSIIGRLLNYLLVPLHTEVFLPERFGVITEMYSYVAFLVVFLTYGMETAYFRFQSKPDANKEKVYGTTIHALLSSTTLFILIVFLFAPSIAEWINYPENQEYVIWFAFIVGLDALSSIPLARLRVENRAIRFATINSIFILINIGLNLFWLYYCAPNYEKGINNFLIDNFYSPSIGVGYVFLANLIASAVKFLLLTPYVLKAQKIIDRQLIKQMLIYGSPLLISSLAIIINETADKIMLKWMLIDDLGVEGATEVVGIYGACYKLSIIITLFIQAFRYAAEPFFFAQEKEKNANEVYAKLMKYFIIITSFIFLAVMLYIDIFKHFIRNEAFWVGLDVVPILLIANILFGVFYNLSIWYKLGSKTHFGAYIASFGAVITIALNIILIPSIQYMGSAWATLICYGSMVILSYLLGQKYYPINYPVKRILFYLSFAIVLFMLSERYNTADTLTLKLAINTIVLGIFTAFIYVLEKPKKAIIS